MKQKYSTLYLKILRLAIGVLFLIAPFYAPLTVVLASHWQHFDFFKIWKEIVLAALGLTIITFLITHRQFARRVFKNRLVTTIAIYITLVLTIGTYDLLTGRVSDDAIIFGWLVDLRPLGFFLVTLLTFAISRQQRGFSDFPWRKLVLLPALVVVSFGLLQMTVLPNDFLTHLGYSDTTIRPYGTVDNQSNIVRIQSTLRGSNSLGAYLIIVITLVVGAFIADKGRRRLLWGAFALCSLVVLFGTYSRSAEIGMLLAMIVLAITTEARLLKKHIYIASAAFVIAAAGVFFAAANRSYVAQNILYHTSSKSTSQVSSNDERTGALKRGVLDIWHQPLGGGVGSAGPASGRNDKGGVRIAENYFLQIGQEVGILGMLLFIAINILIALELWRRRGNMLASILLASLVGLTLVNMLLHAWTDDVLAYTWWGLAGIALAPAILGARQKRQ